jgi:hypothetical protein
MLKRLFSTAVLEAQCGFDRAGWRAERCANTLKLVDSHVIALTAQPSEEWSNAAHLTAPLSHFQRELMEQQAGFCSATGRVKVSLARPSAGLSQPQEESWIVLRKGWLTPYKIVFAAASSTSTPNARLVAQLALGSVGVEQVRPFASSITELADRRMVFVCCHGAVDRRCGVCGPLLLKAFTEEARAVERGVELFAISHVGGHQFAPNVVAMHRNRSIWLGFVGVDESRAVIDWLCTEQDDDSTDALSAMPEALRERVRGTTHLTG